MRARPQGAIPRLCGSLAALAATITFLLQPGDAQQGELG